MKFGLLTRLAMEVLFDWYILWLCLCIYICVYVLPYNPKLYHLYGLFLSHIFHLYTTYLLHNFNSVNPYVYMLKETMPYLLHNLWLENSCIQDC